MTTKVKFTRDYTVQDAEGKKYDEGKQYNLSDASAFHFIRRGVAEIVESKEAK